jgi:hypothetical protein
MNKVLVNRPLLRITAVAHSDDCVQGRFGGGWHWAFGARLNKNATKRRGSALIELVTFTIRIDWGTKCQ